MNRFAEANFARINNKAGFLMGIIRRVKEDGPDGGGADLKVLPRSVEHAIRSLMDEVCHMGWMHPCLSPEGFGAHLIKYWMSSAQGCRKVWGGNHHRSSDL